MNNQQKLTTIKIIHTLIWLFFNVVLLYMAYAVVTDKIDRYVWIGIVLIILEGLVLLLFRKMCPPYYYGKELFRFQERQL